MAVCALEMLGNCSWGARAGLGLAQGVGLGESQVTKFGVKRCPPTQWWPIVVDPALQGVDQVGLVLVSLLDARVVLVDHAQ